MASEVKRHYTVVAGFETEANDEAIRLVASLPDSEVKVIAGCKAASERFKLPCVQTPEGYFVTGIGSIRDLVQKHTSPSALDA